MPRIFVSYRRKDSSGHAGRLFDRLAQHFGDAVFRDVDKLKPGEDFVEALARALDSAQVFILVIGREWVDARDDDGNRRLDNPDDFIRIEVESALRRKDLMILPVLVEGAPMVEASHLPEALRPLARRQALELSEHRWDFDVQELLRRIEEIIGRQRPAWKTAIFVGATAGVILLAAAGLGMRFGWMGLGAVNPPEPETSAAAPPVTRPPVTQPAAFVQPRNDSPPSSAAPPAAQPADAPRKPDVEQVAQRGKSGEARAERADPAGRGDSPSSSRQRGDPAGPRADLPSQKSDPSEKVDVPKADSLGTKSDSPGARTDSPELKVDPPATRVAVPGVVGREARSAIADLRTLGLDVKAEHDSVGRERPGNVFAQRPPAGSMAERGDVILVYVEEPLRSHEHAAGRRYLSLSEVIDLDRDGEGRQGWDVSFDRATGAGFSLSFGNAARGTWLRGASGISAPLDATACAAVSPLLTSVPIAESATGQILCVKTTAGRTALIQLSRLTMDPPELGVRYSTLTARPAAPVHPPIVNPRPADTQQAGATSGRVRVPRLTGEPSRRAAEILNNLGVRIKIEYNSVGRVQPGTVFAQDPDAGAVVDRGALVHVHVEMELAPGEHSAGRFSVSPNEVTQLDRDEPNVRIGWDFSFRGTAGTGFYLEFGSGAEGALVRRPVSDPRSVDSAACRGVRLSAGRVPLVNPLNGQIVCVKTTRGRSAVVHLGRLTPEPPELYIRYSTTDIHR